MISFNTTMLIFKLLIFGIIFILTYSAPALNGIKTFKKPEKEPIPTVSEPTPTEATDLGIFYDDYLKDVLKILNGHSDFRKKIENTNIDEIKAGKISDVIDFFPETLREKLNFLKKQEYIRLRKMLQAKSDLDNGRQVKRSPLLTEIATHLDHDSPHTFEARDLTNLIKAAAKDLKDFDLARHDDFKKHAMDKEMRREDRLKKLSQLDRMKEEDKYIKQQEEIISHIPKINPGSKEQLEHVWKEEDHLEGQEFDPKTFFSLHDFNNDGILDSAEIESLFDRELESLKNASSEEYDDMTLEEERRRMREYMTRHVDKNRDSLVSFDEFLSYTKSDEFEHPDKNAYKTVLELLHDHALYTADELRAHRKHIREQEEEIEEKLGIIKNQSRILDQLKDEFEEMKEEADEDDLHDEMKHDLKKKAKKIMKKIKVIKYMKKDIKEQKQDLKDLKNDLKKHEVGKKAAEMIKNELESLPSGEEKKKAIDQALDRLKKLKKLQDTDLHNDNDDDDDDDDDGDDDDHRDDEKDDRRSKNKDRKGKKNDRRKNDDENYDRKKKTPRSEKDDRRDEKVKLSTNDYKSKKSNKEKMKESEKKKDSLKQGSENPSVTGNLPQ